ncbi:MAG TPA: type III-A CRISPR-associated RAMP protein Csm4 [Mobilitalea sp.]|nr:type III-A CRISPR-associated RAMP protein Csm4 [Mobilitalea sp.]
MNYYLLKLKFKSPLHIGDSGSAKSLDTSNMIIRADTLFSALCHTALQVDDEKGISELLEYVTSGTLILSDTMPYCGKRLFLPKPVLALQDRAVITADKRKRIKKINYIPVDMYEAYIAFIGGKSTVDIKDIDFSFGSHYVVDKAAVRGLDNSMPYSVGLFSFDNGRDCGLYVIIGYGSCDVLEKVIKLLKLLGLGGIGGKVSSGYGKYEVIEETDIGSSNDEQIDLLRSMLDMKDPDCYILLTTSLPSDDELKEVTEGSTYTLIRRGGFTQSANSSSYSVKKQTQYFFSSGSVFKKTFKGCVYNVAEKAGHPVYRYSKPMFLGVKT